MRASVLAVAGATTTASASRASLMWPICCVLTKGAQEFVTPLAAAALAGQRAHTDLFDRADEAIAGSGPATCRPRCRRR
jgi:ABC-type sugar transport system substrate-binding protein